MAYIYNMVDSWNNGATVFTAIKMNVTDSASDVGSLLMNLLVGASSKFSIGKSGGLTIPAAANVTAAALTQTLSGSNVQSILDLAATWNTSGTPTALRLNVTDTASNAASLLMDLRVGGTSMVSISKDGRVRATSGSVASPSFSFTGDTNTGIYNRTADVLAFVVNGINQAEVTTDSFRMTSTQLFSWSSAGAGAAAGDVVLARDAAGILAQRNSTNAQAFRVFNTYTDSSNYERGIIGWSSNILELGTEVLGTGTARAVRLKAVGNQSVSIATNGNDRWTVNGSGHLLGNVDNTYDIGASGSFRPRSIYVGSGVFANTFRGTGVGNAPLLSFGSGTQTLTGSDASPLFDLIATWNTSGTPTAIKLNVTNTASNAASLLIDLQVASSSRFSVDNLGNGIFGSNLQVVASGLISFGTSRSVIRSDADGQIRFTNAANTSFTLLKFGGSSTSFPALKRNSANLEARLADDSDYTTFRASGFLWSAGTVVTEDAVNILAQRAGSNAQTLRLYKTYTDASNYERLTFTSQAFSLDIVSEAAGTGAQKNLRIGSNSSVPYVALFTNATERLVVTGTGLVVIGQNTASYPALKRSTTTLQIRLGDDSAYTSVQMLNALVEGYSKYTPVAVSALPAAATAGAGARLFVNDALTPTWGATVANGGAVTVPVYSDGTNWKVG